MRAGGAGTAGVREFLPGLHGDRTVPARAAPGKETRRKGSLSTALLTATGHLNAREIGLAVEIYDPEIDYDKVKGKWIGFGAPGQ